MRRTRSYLTLVLLSLVACGDEDAPLPDTAPRCEDGQFSGDALCLNGAFVSCATLTGHCRECGCRDQALCDSFSGNCTPLVTITLGALHDECDVHDDCASKNCGSVKATSAGTKECLVEIGTSCTEDNCQLCRSDGTASVCARGCRDDSEPAQLITPSGATFYCLVDLITDAQLYRPACAAGAKPCALSSESCWEDAVGTRYCSGKPGSSDAFCTVTSECDAPLVCSGRLRRCRAPADDGNLCDEDEECASGHCYGNCVAALPDGAVCDAASDCASGRCESTRCRKALSPLGETCRVALDCASNVCNGVCTQSASGEACASADECLSGLCLETCAYSASSPGAFKCTALKSCSSSYCSNVCYDGDLPRSTYCRHSAQCADELGEPSVCIAEHCDQKRLSGEYCSSDDECMSSLCSPYSGCF